jgi:hypothetical protein
MADEDKIKNSEEASNSEADDLFRQQSEIQPLRTEGIEDEDLKENGGEYETIEERIAGSHKLTDLQVADKRLNPDLGYKYLNVIQMSRVFPDIYNPLFRIMVKNLIKNSNLSVAEAIAYVNTAASIGIDGEGRIDEITIMKHSVVAEEVKNKGGNL